MPSAERAGQGPRNSWHFPSDPHKGCTERPCLGRHRGLEERGTQASESRTLSCPLPAPPPARHLLCWFPASTPASQRHQPRGSPVKLPRDARGASARETPPSGAHGQVPCGLLPPGIRVQDKRLLRECKLIEGAKWNVEKTLK